MSCMVQTNEVTFDLEFSYLRRKIKKQTFHKKKKKLGRFKKFETFEILLSQDYQDYKGKKINPIHYYKR